MRDRREHDQELLSALAELAPLPVSEDLQATLQRLVELGARHIPGADEAGITLSDGDAMETSAFTSPVVCDIDQAQYDSDDGPCLSALRDGRVYEVPDTATDARWPAFGAAAAGHGVGSSLSLPLGTEDGAAGALNVYARSRGSFDEQSRVVGQVVAHHACVALSNARAYQAAVSAVVTLQRSLLPAALPDAPGLRLAARYLPATSQSRVGGDWYDVVVRERGAAVTIGDVAGHGLRAAGVMGQLCTAVHAYALEGHRPGRVIELIHRLFGEMGIDGMATLCHAVVERRAGGGASVTFANAGHLPLLLVPREGPPLFLEALADGPLGAPAPDRVPDSRADLDDEATLLLFTDGLVERRGETIDAGLRRLAAVVRDGPRDVEALCDHVVDSLLADGIADDVALLAIRLAPADADA